MKTLLKPLNLLVLFVITSLFFVPLKTTAQTNYNIDNRVTSLIKNGVKFDSLKVIIRDIIHTRDTTYLIKQLEKIIKITSKNKNSKQYVYTLIGYGQLQTKNNIPYLNEAYGIAKKKDYNILLGHILDTKIVIFKERKLHDSLLVTLIEAKDIYEKSNNKKQLVAILHATADLYYSAKLYDKAEKIYQEILDKKGDKDEWKFWRNEVILNNLGLIEMKRHKYFKALKYFNEALKTITKDRTSPRYAIALGYNELQLSKCYLNIGKDSLASYYYKKSLSYCLKKNMTDELIQLYNLKSELFLKKGKVDSSLFYTKKALNTFNDNKNISKENLLTIYKSLYKISNKTKNYKKAYTYLNLYSKLKDSLDNASQSIKRIQTFEEHKYQKIAAKKNQLKTRNNYLLIIILSSFIFITIILSYYSKLNKAHLKLVDKNLEIASQNTFNIENKHPKVSDKYSKAITKEQIELVTNFERFLGKDKFFLNHNISINDVAHHLNTNRTYLSKAINMILKKNFNSHINNLRIREAVRMLSSEEFKKITLEAISKEVGFNNKVSFNEAFKNYTGVLPSYFMKNAHKS
ncbi:MAG: helix-turn-helix domain-containing protein [Flavobacteriaceae bacterium]|nr:helix-turn-helix domain-containing protein [Flavobacteriaceae bacterium]